MAIALSELLVAKTADQVLNGLLAELKAGGFPTTSWQSGDPERTLLEAEATTQVDLWATVYLIASGGHVDLATGAWLTLLAKQRYNLDRIGALATVGRERLTCSASAGPYTITAGQLQFKGAGGNLYVNSTGGTLNSGGTLDVTIRAVSPGLDEGNDGDETITAMTTPLAGVTCTNPPYAFSDVSQTGSGTGSVTPSGGPEALSFVLQILTSGQVGVATYRASDDGGITWYGSHTVASFVNDADGNGLDLTFANGSSSPSFVAGDYFTFESYGAWYTTRGADEEDDASLRQRCKARWPELSSTPTDDVYTSMCKRADASVRKVRVAVDAVVPAKVNITIASSSGTVASPVVTAVQAYVDARRPLTDVPVVSAAGTMALTLAGATVRVKAQNLARAQQAGQVNVAAYFASVAIGDGSTVKVRYSQIIEAILRESGDEDDSVTGLTLNGGAVDLVVTANAVVTWAQVLAAALTWSTY